jgi:high affinity Mn2+ porin
LYCLIQNPIRLPAPIWITFVLLGCLLTNPAWAADAEHEAFNFHGQTTLVDQWYQGLNGGGLGEGSNSLSPHSQSAETIDLTVFLGARLWEGAGFYFNPEIDQGFGLGNTLGLAGYTSGEAYKVGAQHPYFRAHRYFIRQTLNLGGDPIFLDDQANQLAQLRTTNHVILTFGKFSVVDIFDTNAYAHDPRGDFLNWAGIDAGAFDYAADSWGYTDGLAVEWTQGEWTWRNGFFDLSQHPNSENIDQGFKQYQLVTEFEARYPLWNYPGKLKLLAFANRGKMASYSKAIEMAGTGQLPSVAQAGVRQFDWKTGFALNLEQAIHPDIGVFARFSFNDGSKETYEFSDINQSLSIGISYKGLILGRPEDSMGMQLIVNSLSSQAKRYFAAGGLGLLIGDGYLNYGPERIVEIYYNLQMLDHLGVSLDLQNISNPAYNTARGPVTIYALRFHAEF